MNTKKERVGTTQVHEKLLNCFTRKEKRIEVALLNEKRKLKN